MKLKFRIYQYKNGLGESVFQVKSHGGFMRWGWSWIEAEYPYDAIRQWNSREAVMETLTKMADRERERLIREGNDRLAATLKLVVMEEVEV